MTVAKAPVVQNSNGQPIEAVPVMTVDTTGAYVAGGGGGGGGAVTIADGADIALGAKADTAWSGTGSASAISIWKAIYGGLTDTSASLVKFDQTTPGTTNGVQVTNAVLAVDTVVKATATDRGTIVGFTATAAAATTASTTLTVTATSGVPIVGQTITGTGITAGTTITAVSGSAPYSLTLSAAATVANGAAVTSNGGQPLMALNAARRGYKIQNQHATADIYINAQATATADYHSLKIPAGSYYESQPGHVDTGAVSIISTVASAPVYAREW